jgi:hypothetical protein
VTDADGNYRLMTFKADDGALVGRHRVTVTKQVLSGANADEAGLSGRVGPGGIQRQIVVPEHYGKRETSGLEADIKPGPNELNFDLTSSAPPAGEQAPP